MSGRAESNDFDRACMERALALAAKGYGGTSPNPMVGAVIARHGQILGEGWHKRAGEPHAEVNAIRAALKRGARLDHATIYVTLEPCSTHGRTPPCTDAILEHRCARVVVAARDPNPKHAGRGLRLLRQRGLTVEHGLLRVEAEALNEVFNHWIVRGVPFVHLKCAMSLDGKIATNTGESKWITGARARAYGMRLRLGADAIVAGINTIVRDDPALTLRPAPGAKPPKWKQLRRVVIDPAGRSPLTARVLTDEHAALTTVVVGPAAPRKQVQELERRARVLRAPAWENGNGIDLREVLVALEREGVTSLLVEGGGETHYRFLEQDLVQRVHFLYAPTIITGRNAAKAVGGGESLSGGNGMRLSGVEWKTLGRDLLMTGRID